MRRRSVRAVAIFHYSVHKVVSRGAGRSAVRSAAYLCREKLRDERTGMSYDYRPRESTLTEPVSEIARASAYIDRADGFEEGRKAALFTGLYGPPGAPEWTRGREHIGEFWNRLEQFEKHERAQLAVPIDIALPHELSLDQNRVLIQDHIRERFTRRGYVVQLAIHAPEHGEDRNVHAHLLVSTRQVDEHGFVASKAANREHFIHRSEYVQDLREHWERTTNRHLARHGHEIRIDRRTLREQGIERSPTLHRGPWRDAAEREVSRMERERQALDRAAEQRHEREQGQEQGREQERQAERQVPTTDPFAAARAFWRKQVQQQQPAPEQKPERAERQEQDAAAWIREQIERGRDPKHREEQQQRFPLARLKEQPREPAPQSRAEQQEQAMRSYVQRMIEREREHKARETAALDPQRAERQERAAAFWQRTIDEGRALRQQEKGRAAREAERHAADWDARIDAKAEEQQQEQKPRAGLLSQKEYDQAVHAAHGQGSFRIDDIMSEIDGGYRCAHDRASAAKKALDKHDREIRERERDLGQNQWYREQRRREMSGFQLWKHEHTPWKDKRLNELGEQRAGIEATLADLGERRVALAAAYDTAEKARQSAYTAALPMAEEEQEHRQRTVYTAELKGPHENK